MPPGLQLGQQPVQNLKLAASVNNVLACKWSGLCANGCVVGWEK